MPIPRTPDLQAKLPTVEPDPVQVNPTGCYGGDEIKFGYCEGKTGSVTKQKETKKEQAS